MDFICVVPDCAKGFSTKSEWIGHIEECHSGDKHVHIVKNDKGQKTDVKSVIVCELCDKIFENRLQKYNHKIFQHTVTAETLTCEYCTMVCNDMMELCIHISSKHKEMFPKVSEQGNNCEICYEIYRSKEEVTKHMNERHSPDSFYEKIVEAISGKCRVCDKSFSPIEMGEHFRLTHKTENIKNDMNSECSKRGRMFKSEENMREHKCNDHSPDQDKIQVELIKEEPTEFEFKTFAAGYSLKMKKGPESKKYSKAFDEIEKLIKGANKGSELFASNGMKIKVVDLPPQLQVKNVNANIEVSTKDLTGLFNVIFYGNKSIKIGKVKGHTMEAVTLFAEKILKPHLISLIKGDSMNQIRSKKPQEQTIKGNQDSPCSVPLPEENIKERNSCDLCGKQCKNKNGLNIHMGRCHPDQTPLRQGEAKKPTMEPKYECSYCDMMFPTKLHLHLHISVMHNTAVSNQKEDVRSGLMCDICNQMFSDGEVYIKHTISCHDKETGEKRVHQPDSEDLVKTHKRDQHEIDSPTVSPPPKKKKGTSEKVNDIIDNVLEMVVEDKDEPVIKHPNETCQEEQDETNDQNNLFMILGFEEARLYDRVKEINEIEKDMSAMKTEEEEIRERKQLEKAKIEAVEASKQKKYDDDYLNEADMNTPEGTDNDNTNKSGKEMYEFFRDKCTKVPESYRQIFALKGLNIDHFGIKSTPGDGLCGAHCLVIHTTLDEGREEAMVLRREINLRKVTMWETYKADYAFDAIIPHEEIVGMTTKLFREEEEYLEFVRGSKEAETMWMTQSDLQVAADLYNTTIHTLETGVPRTRLRENPTQMEQEGFKVKARWTEIRPINKSTEDKVYVEEVGDVYLINNSQSHFNLLVHKDSELAKRGTLSIAMKRQILRKIRRQLNQRMTMSCQKIMMTKKRRLRMSTYIVTSKMKHVRKYKQCQRRAIQDEKRTEHT